MCCLSASLDSCHGCSVSVPEFFQKTLMFCTSRTRPRQCHVPHSEKATILMRFVESSQWRRSHTATGTFSVSSFAVGEHGHSRKEHCTAPHLVILRLNRCNGCLHDARTVTLARWQSPLYNVTCIGRGYTTKRIIIVILSWNISSTFRSCLLRGTFAQVSTTAAVTLTGLCPPAAAAVALWSHCRQASSGTTTVAFRRC